VARAIVFIRLLYFLVLAAPVSKRAKRRGWVAGFLEARGHEPSAWIRIYKQVNVEVDRVPCCIPSPSTALAAAERQRSPVCLLWCRPGLSARQPLFGGPGAQSDQLQINIESGTVDLDDEIDQLRHSVGRLKQVGRLLNRASR
jgi:hypothetical protein